MSIECKSTGHTLWFFKEKNELPDNVDPAETPIPNIKISNVNVQNTGVYKCYGQYLRKNCSTRFIAFTRVIVIGEKTVL